MGRVEATQGRGKPLRLLLDDPPSDEALKTISVHAYEVRPRKDHRGVDLISDAMHYSRSVDAVIRVYDAAGNVIATHESAGDFRE